MYVVQNVNNNIKFMVTATSVIFVLPFLGTPYFYIIMLVVINCPRKYYASSYNFVYDGINI